MKSHDSDPLHADGQYALFNTHGHVTPYALPPEENRAIALPEYVIDQTDPYREQTGGESTYAHVHLSDDEALQLIRQGLGGREEHRTVSRMVDRMRDGTYWASPIDIQGRNKAHRAYMDASKALARKIEERNAREEESVTEVDENGIIKRRQPPHTLPAAVKNRAYRDKHPVLNEE